MHMGVKTRDQQYWWLHAQGKSWASLFLLSGRLSNIQPSMQKVAKTVHQYWWLHVHLVSENTQLPRTVSVYTCHLSVDQKFSLCESFWLCASAEYTLCVLSFAWLWYMFCPMGQLISWGRHALSARRPRGQAAITRPWTLRRFWSRGQGRLWPLKVSAMARLSWGLCSVSRVLYFPVSNCARLWHAFCATGLCVWSLESKWMNQILTLNLG